ncbi:MAG TPA: DUF3037 domain-containing protein [Puia sp.]|nr:DUF3037 domain-containing protein [Puia sp.]
MQEKHLFEYAVIRLVPRVEREEFLNTGVILYCAAENFLQVKFSVNKARIEAMAPVQDIEEIEMRLEIFDQICRGSEEGGSIGRLPLASRFRWLTATRSTIVQVSPVHPGLCLDARETLEKLFEELVR